MSDLERFSEAVTCHQQAIEHGKQDKKMLQELLEIHDQQIHGNGGT
jgi:hypothetical protein